MSCCRASTRPRRCPGCWPGCPTDTARSSPTTAPPTARRRSPPRTARSSCRVPQRGFGAAAHAGPARRRPTDGVVCFLDADGSLDPRQLPRVADPVRAGAADLVLGRRRPTAPRRVAGARPAGQRGARRGGCAARRRCPCTTSARCGPPAAPTCSPWACATGGSAIRWRWWCAPPGPAGGSREVDVDYAPARRRAPGRR